MILFVRSIPLASAPYSAIITSLPLNKDVDMVHKILTLLICLEHAPDAWQLDLGSDWERIFSSNKQQERISEIIVASSKQFGLERSLKMLTNWMLKRPAASMSIVRNLVNETDIPYTVKRTIAKHCSYVKESETAEDTSARQYLNSILDQRHPEAVASAIKAAGENALLPKGQSASKRQSDEMDVDVGESVDSDMMDLEEDMTPFIQAVSADLQTRTTGISILLDTFESLSPEERQSLQMILKSALTENEGHLIETIYGRAEVVTALLSASEIIDAVSVPMYKGETKRDVVVKHVSFASTLPAQFPDEKHLDSKIFRQIVFPIMMFTKSRRVTVSAAWKALLELPAGSIPPIEGIEALFDESDIKEADENIYEKRIDRIASIVARNLARESLATGNAKFLLDQTASQNDMVRAYALLVVSKFLGEIGPAVQPFVLSELNKVIPRWPVYEDVETALKPSEIADRIYSKPTQAKTLAALQDHCLTGIRHMKLAPAIRHWIMPSDVNELEPARTALKGIYALVNSSALAPSTARSILHSIFGKLRERSLVFLADTWSDERQPVEIRYSAATHGHAYLAACGDEQGKSRTDFQCLIPSVLVLLTDEDKTLREAGIALVKQLHAGMGDVIEDIYAVDDLYGPETAKVKLLQAKEARFYLETILKEAAGLLADKGYLAVLHGRSIHPVSAENKKGANICRAVIAMLSSHIASWKLNGPRVKLLHSLSQISEVTKLDGLTSVFVDLNDPKSTEMACLKRLAAGRSTSYLEAVFDVLDKVTAKQFAKGTHEELFKVILSMINCNLPERTGQMADTNREHILRQLNGTAFTQLSLIQQEDLVLAVVEALPHLTEASRRTCKSSLRDMPLSGDGLVDILRRLTQETASDDSNRTKRARTEDNSEKTFPIGPLMGFLESRSAAEIPVDPRLVTLGLDILAIILDHRKSIDGGSADFVEQSLLTLMINILDQIQDRRQLGSESLGVEVLVKLIRSSSNPRTSQMALLFIGSLARLVPDAVLHNVMPIFTYVGSSDFQRDDAYSFAVVEKTVESTVPVIVQSMRAKTTSELSLFIEARPLLRIFADMAQRLPKHRTLPFYVHLVTCMGISDFLAPVAMLLATSGKKLKVDNDASRLAKSLVGRFEPALRLQVCARIIRLSFHSAD